MTGSRRLVRPSLKIWLWGVVTGVGIACGTIAAADIGEIHILPAPVEVTAEAEMPVPVFCPPPDEGTTL